VKTVTTGFFISSFLLAGIVYSHTGATGIVKERMDAMLDMGDKSKLVADMFKGKSEFDRNAVHVYGKNGMSSAIKSRSL